MRDAMRVGLLGMMDTPHQGNLRPEGVPWAADNGCFSDKWDATKWWSWLTAQSPDDCLFAVAPDVVADWAATLKRSLPYLAPMRALGFPVALVLQDGVCLTDIPWNDIDAVFVGGTTEFKLSGLAQLIVSEARRRGKWCHMGRVNTLRRLRLAKRDGYDSVDGTYLTFGPDVNLPKLLRYLDTVDTQDGLEGIA